ncbi:lipoprotein, partial [uncultured Duncaniella sp.]
MRKLVVYIVATILLAGCSTTKRLGKDDILYTGLKGVDVTTPDNEKF